MRIINKNILFSSVLVILLAAFAVSCDGEAGFSPPDEVAAGIYTGTIEEISIGWPDSDLIGIVSENNDVHLFAAANPVHLVGRIDVSQTKLDGRLTAYVGETDRFFGVDELAKVLLDGHMTGTVGASGVYSGPGVEGEFSLTYDADYETAVSLDMAAGVWSFGQAGYTVTFDIDNTGQLFGTDTNGCVFAGQIEVIRNGYNAFQVTLAISNCDAVNGDYGGLAFLGGGAPFGTLFFSVANDNYAYAAVLQ